MAIYKRWHGKTISTHHPRWKEARWTVEFVLRGRRIIQSVPEARTQAQAERAQTQLREDIYNRRYSESKSMGLSQFFDNNYLPWLKENRSESAYRDALSRCKELKAFFKNQPVREISTKDCEQFKVSLKKGTTPRKSLRSSATVNRYIYLLSAVFTRAITEEMVTTNPCALLGDEPEQGRERYLTVEEEARLKAVLTGELGYLRAPLHVSLGTGLRKNVELLRLKIEHLNFTARPIFYPVRGGNVEIPPGWLIVLNGKGGKYRLVPMNSEVRAILSELTQDRNPDEYVFDREMNGVNHHWIRRGFREACERAGIVFGEVNPGGIIWHDLRRTFATRLRAHGVHEYDIQDLLGHAKPGVTKIYARATVANLEQAVEKLTQPLGRVIELNRQAG